MVDRMAATCEHFDYEEQNERKPEHSFGHLRPTGSGPQERDGEEDNDQLEWADRITLIQ